MSAQVVWCAQASVWIIQVRHYDLIVEDTSKMTRRGENLFLSARLGTVVSTWRRRVRTSKSGIVAACYFLNSVPASLVCKLG